MAPPVLGLGNIGPLASKPVMEGQRRFCSRSSPASNRCFDIEIARRHHRPAWSRTVAALGADISAASNLEDIKGPECFEIEGPSSRPRHEESRCFNDDQHGNRHHRRRPRSPMRLLLNGKSLKRRPRSSPPAAGAAGDRLSQICWFSMGRAAQRNIWGRRYRWALVHEGRTTLIEPLEVRLLRRRPTKRVLGGRHRLVQIIFLGLSAPNVLTPRHGQADGRDKPLVIGAGKSDARKIMPDEARKARPRR